MSDPFRSELEAAHAKLKRAEDEIAELREEKARLEQARATPPSSGPSTWRAIGLAVLGAAIVGAVFVANRRDAAKEEAEAERFSREQTEAAKKIAWGSLTGSASAIASAPPASEPCDCKPTDLVCPCILGGGGGTAASGPPFDRGAAARELGALPIDLCARGEAARTVHVKVTFAPTGGVMGATIDQGADALDDHERSCVVGAVQKVNVPAFGGPPVFVGKTYTLRKSAAP